MDRHREHQVDPFGRPDEIPFPGTIVPKVGTKEYEVWKSRMGMWAYVNGPRLLALELELAEIKRFLAG